MTRNRTSARPHAKTVLSLTALALLITGAVLYAGPLNPPAGPISSTYKTLTEVEPRIAINAANTPGDSNSLFKITQPGSYYLTGNITGVVGKHGIEITASGVTLDLNGFDLVGVPAMGFFDGVRVTVNGLTNIAVTHGSVRNWGGDGINIGTFQPVNCRVDDVRVSGNSVNGIRAGSICTISNCSASSNTFTGIVINNGSTVTNCSACSNGTDGVGVGSGCTVTNCLAFSNAGRGIVGQSGTVINCSARSNAGDGIFANACEVANCSADSNLGSGISGGPGCTVANCTTRINTSHGFAMTDDCTVTGCTSTLNQIDGIHVNSGCRVTENTCNRNGTAGFFSGILANGNNNLIERNHVSGNDAGISTPPAATGNIIIRNTATGNSVSYNVQNADNIVGTVVTNTAALNAATNSNVNVSH